MKTPKVISVFLIDGEPEGRLAGEISNWTGKAFKIPRTLLKESAKREELTKAGVYFLFGKSEDDPEESAVYVGESEEVYKRLTTHKKEEFWTEVLVFTSKDENLNKAHVKYLESKLYEEAKTAKRYVVTNPNTPTCPAISEPEKAVMSEFMTNLKILTSTLGYKLFEPLASPGDKQKNLYFIKGARGANAKAVITHEGVVVLAGSEVSQSTVPSLTSPFVRHRDKLIAQGVIAPKDGKLRFTKDHLFSSPSTAAAVVMGRNANGRLELKDKEGAMLKDKEEANEE